MDRGFKTKPALAIDMIERALDAGVPAKWAAGDAVYGQYHRLRRTLEERGIYYVLAVPVSQRVVVKDGSFLGVEKRADAAVPDLVKTAWRTRSAGDGAKGVRDYAWARVRINGAEDGRAVHWLLARRSLAKPEEIAYFICYTPKRVAVAEMARIAGVRWSIEETFQTAKGEAGLDHYQVRQYTGWHRHVTLSMIAHAS